MSLSFEGDWKKMPVAYKDALVKSKLVRVMTYFDVTNESPVHKIEGKGSTIDALKAAEAKYGKINAIVGKVYNHTIVMVFRNPGLAKPSINPGALNDCDYTCSDWGSDFVPETGLCEIKRPFIKKLFKENHPYELYVFVNAEFAKKNAESE